MDGNGEYFPHFHNKGSHIANVTRLVNMTAYAATHPYTLLPCDNHMAKEAEQGTPFMKGDPNDKQEMPWLDGV
jgi:hypothetical protein